MAKRYIGIGTDEFTVGQGPLMFRNRIINGNFDIWQRGTSQTSIGYGSDDRWHNAHAGSTKTASRQSFTLGQTDVPGNPTYFSRHVVTSAAGASNYCLKQQSIEDVRTFAGQTVTLSFWAKADASKNLGICFDQVFGTGGSPSAVVSGIGATKVALTTSWQKFTLTVAIPSISGKTLGTNDDSCLRLRFWFDAGSDYNSSTSSLGQQSGTFDIAQVQLEAGSSATEFEQRPLGLELSLCQRYYYRLRGENGNAFQDFLVGATADQSTFARYCVVLPVTMRSRPTLDASAAGSFANLNSSGAQQLSAIAIDGSGTVASTQIVQLACTSSGLTTGQATVLRAFNSTTAYINFSAEL